MKNRHLVSVFFSIAILVGASSLFASESAESEIQAILKSQQDAWNRGDIEAFMSGYWHSDETVFVSGDEVTRGWQTVLDRYKKKYSDRDKMGTLTFSGLEIKMLGDTAAVALGRWELKRKTDNPHGHFTLIFRKVAEGWRIVHDHTSSAPEK